MASSPMPPDEDSGAGAGAVVGSRDTTGAGRGAMSGRTVFAGFVGDVVAVVVVFSAGKSREGFVEGLGNTERLDEAVGTVAAGP